MYRVQRKSLHFINLHHFVTKVIDHLDSNTPRDRLFEWSRGIAVEGGPGVGVDFGFEGGFQGFVGIALAEEIGVADEKAFAVVVGVDEPAGDVVGFAGDDFAGGGVEDVDAVHFDAVAAVRVFQEIDIGFAEDDEEVALAGIFEFGGHVEVGVHAGLEDMDAAEFVEFGGHGVEREAATDKDVEIGVAGLAGGFDQFLALHSAEFGADEDGGSAFGVAFQVAAFGADQAAGPRYKGGEVDLPFLVRLLDAGGAEIVENHVDEGDGAGTLGGRTL